MSIEKEFSFFEKHPKTSIAKWVLFFALLIGGATTLTYVFMPAKMAIERQVIINSHQYKEGMQQRANILQANIEEVKVMIAQDPTNEQLKGQLRALTAQYKATLK